jgi:hypothetical protein
MGSFKKIQSQIAAKEGVSKDRAGAILASSARKASPAAVRANPKLKRVSGVKKFKRGGVMTCESYHTGGVTHRVKGKHFA